MIKDVITYLNTKITALHFFNEVLCLVERIEKEGKIYPALYNGGNEYVQINLDATGSKSYWRKNGDVTFSQNASQTSIGIEYTSTIPLKLIGFLPKDAAQNDQYFSDNICLAIISELTVNNSALKPMLKAKKASVSCTKYVTDAKSVAGDEYENIAFEPRYTHSYFSIDFELVFITNSQCYDSLC